MIEHGKIRRLNKELSPELKQMEEYFISQVENNSDKYFSKYNSLESSFNGQYICSDLFKETFDEYTESIETRMHYSEVIHNSCAVMAGELFERQAKNPNIQKCIFLTGVPGAGKSYLIQSLFLQGIISNDTMVFEGDISSPSIREKFEMVKNNGKEIHIIVVNPTLELAQENAIRRHFEIGRGASSSTMARILAGIPNAIANLSQDYDITVGIFNKSSNYDIETVVTDDIDEIMANTYHGTKEEIEQRLLELREQLLPGIREEFEKKKLGIEEEEYIPTEGVKYGR